MKEIQDLTLPDDVRYSSDHEWARPASDLFELGISDYAQDQLGDIVYVELPETGTALKKDQEFGSVESVKAVSELIMPMGGTVVEVNPALEENPELVNSDPYAAGWMLRIKPEDPAEFDGLLSRDDYQAMLKE